MNIAFIGTGVMGAAMATQLKKAGHDLKLFNRSHEKTAAAAEQMEELGTGSVQVAATLAHAVEDADAVITMVGFPADVEAIYLGTDGIFSHTPEGALLIDMTTSLPSLAVKLAEVGEQKGFRVLDAPVSGGDSGAKAGTLSIMVGGKEDDFHAAKPLFEAMGKNILYMGPAGNGQHTKAANQIAVAGATAAYSEALHYARRVGLDPRTMLHAIGAGAAGSWQLEHMAPRALAQDFAPGFYVKHFIKDMQIVQREMQDRHESLPMLNTVLQIYQDFAEEGHADDGTQALILHYEPEMEK